MKTKDDTATAAFWLGIIVPFLIFGYLTFIITLKAWVMSWIWHWYVVPTFGVRELRLPYAYGLILLTALMSHPKPSDDDDGEMKSWTDIGKIAAKSVVQPLVILLAGWVTLLFT